MKAFFEMPHPAQLNFLLSGGVAAISDDMFTSKNNKLTAVDSRVFVTVFMIIILYRIKNDRPWPFFPLWWIIQSIDHANTQKSK
jgi:hypothetical protein